MDIHLAYLNIFIFFLISLFLACFLLIITYFFSQKNYYNSKLTSYECGFEPFDDARSSFDVHFYVVAILFMIFDVEVAFLLPWAYNLGCIGVLGFYSGLLFLIILTLGFYYEWVRGALNWSSLHVCHSPYTFSNNVLFF